jgi:hypothetical protein
MFLAESVLLVEVGLAASIVILVDAHHRNAAVSDWHRGLCGVGEVIDLLEALIVHQFEMVVRVEYESLANP